ncbi:MAG: hypothetical protein EB127_31690 [Alphaproteobacteria bacterium]|nr:hypothetical protein [Alphaproteobacteria bacterium]
MDQDIYALVAKYGFKTLHLRLLEIMRSEYEYLQTQFQTVPPVVVKEVVINNEEPSRTKKQRKRKAKVPVATNPVTVTEEVLISSENNEIKDVIVSEKTNNFRDPKEMKEYQKSAVEAKRKENEMAGLDPSHFLTKDNLKQWIEVEGHTYAWVAREKSGCHESQVAATAKMMGIKSRISKKLGRTMTGN